ncbi:MAG: hypothetical protein WBN82_11520 [Porticoccaceae bacterium]
MKFRTVIIFTDSLARLTGDEQKAVKTTAFDLQPSPASPRLGARSRDRAVLGALPCTFRLVP